MVVTVLSIILLFYVIKANSALKKPRQLDAADVAVTGHSEFPAFDDLLPSEPEL